MKSETATTSIPVLIYTAKDVTEEDRRRLLPSARRIFPKVPLQIEEMLEELDHALSAATESDSSSEKQGSSPASSIRSQFAAASSRVPAQDQSSSTTSHSIPPMDSIPTSIADAGYKLECEPTSAPMLAT